MVKSKVIRKKFLSKKKSKKKSKRRRRHSNKSSRKKGGHIHSKKDGTVSIRSAVSILQRYYQYKFQ